MSYEAAPHGFRLPWPLALLVAVLVQAPILLVTIELRPAEEHPEEVTIDLETFLPPPPEPPPPEPPPPEPPPPPPPKEPPPKPKPQPQPKPQPAPVPSPEPVAEPPPEPDPVPPQDPVPEPAEPDPTPPPPPQPPRPPPPPPPKPFDARGYRGAAIGKVERQKRYPKKARVMGLTGRVIVRAYIDKDGNLVGEPRIHGRGSGHSVLDEEALRMVRAAAPFGKLEGEVKRLPHLLVIPVVFELRD